MFDRMGKFIARRNLVYILNLFNINNI